MHRAPRLVGAAVFIAALLQPLSAQSNAVPGMDVELGILGTGQGVGSGQPRVWGRVGGFPNGTIGVSIATTSCNVGAVDVPWIAATGSPMGNQHPAIASLFTRVSDGRMVQISDYSDVKHGFFALTNEQCGGNCNQGPFGGGDVLGMGCSDTYDTFNNGDQFWLAPASEIDPWLGTWNPFGSHFDTGQPDVGAPSNNDGARSLSDGQVSNFSSIDHRVQIRDEDLDVAGADFFYQGYYVIEGEPESTRDNNFRTRSVNVSMAGDWSLSDGGNIQLGTVLEQWNGASVSSGVNGSDDGRVYVAVSVTGPTDGLYHYEYAVHNRDANRGVGSFRLPMCSEGTIANFGFHDIDDNGGNDWSVQRNSNELVFSTGNNPIRWNSIFNFWFDSDAAPEAGSPAYEPFDAGAGSNLVALGNSQVPTGQYNYIAGAGCSFSTPPSVHATGSPAQATIGNASFGATFTGNDAGASLLVLVGFDAGVQPVGAGCNLYMDFSGQVDVLGILAANGSGEASISLPVPNNPLLEGVEVTLQAASQRGAGPLSGQWDLTDALRVRVGDSTVGCP